MNELHNLPTESFKDSCQLCAEILKGEVIQKEGYTVYKVPGSFWYNRNFISVNDPKEMSQITEQTVKDIPLGGPFLIGFTKYDDDTVLDNCATAAGYKFITNQTGMVFDLSKLTEETEDPNIVTIGLERIEEFSNVISRAFEKPEDLEAMKAFAISKAAYVYAYLEMT
jgi:hypothetical protein